MLITVSIHHACNKITVRQVTGMCKQLQWMCTLSETVVLGCIVVQTDNNAACYYVAIFASSCCKVTSTRVSGYPFQYPSGTRFFKYPKVRALDTTSRHPLPTDLSRCPSIYRTAGAYCKNAVWKETRSQSDHNALAVVTTSITIRLRLKCNSTVPQAFDDICNESVLWHYRSITIFGSPAQSM